MVGRRGERRKKGIEGKMKVVQEKGIQEVGKRNTGGGEGGREGGRGLKEESSKSCIFADFMLYM